MQNVNLMSESQLTLLEGHEDAVWSVAFSPDGNKVVSGGLDKMIYLWNIKSFLDS